jgi:hypothetical protein
LFKNKKHIVSTFLLLVFIIPTITLFLHSFSSHEHLICQSKIESHIHQKEAKCELHLLNQGPFYFDNFPIKKFYDTQITSAKSLKNNFLKNHQQLSFSLRGPPSEVQT